MRSQSLFCKEENNTKDVNKMQIETYAPRLARLCLFFPFDLADFIFIFSVRSSFFTLGKLALMAVSSLFSREEEEE